MAGTTKSPATWTPADEATYAELSKRREEVVGKREAELRQTAADVWGDAVNRGPDALAQADRSKCIDALTEALRARCDRVRDALEPFDSGVRSDPAAG